MHSLIRRFAHTTETRGLDKKKKKKKAYVLHNDYTSPKQVISCYPFLVNGTTPNNSLRGLLARWRCSVVIRWITPFPVLSEYRHIRYVTLAYNGTILCRFLSKLKTARSFHSYRLPTSQFRLLVITRFIQSERVWRAVCGVGWHTLVVNGTRIVTTISAVPTMQ